MQNLLILFSLFLSVSSQAQYVGIERDSFNLAYEISAMSPNLSVDQRNKIADQLKAIRDVLYGNASAPAAEYTCVSRDNDGLNPFVIGIRNGVEVKRISGTGYSNKDACLDALQSKKVVPGGALLCMSRDSDGLSPYQIGLLGQNGSLSKISQSSSSSMATCTDTLKKMKISLVKNEGYFCGSRDSDGLSPYIAVGVDLNTGSVKRGGDVFSSLDTCWNSL